jgi:hypothetical protein
VTALPMFSSIHTIHRPVARSKRTSVPKEFRASVAPSEVSLLEEGVTSPSPQTEGVGDIDLHASASDMSRGEQEEDVATRGGTPVSGKTKKRAALSGKLRDIFEVPSIEEVVAGEPIDRVPELTGLTTSYRDSVLPLPVHLFVHLLGSP